MNCGRLPSGPSVVRFMIISVAFPMRLVVMTLVGRVHPMHVVVMLTGLSNPMHVVVVTLIGIMNAMHVVMLFSHHCRIFMVPMRSWRHFPRGGGEHGAARRAQACLLGDHAGSHPADVGDFR